MEEKSMYSNRIDGTWKTSDIIGSTCMLKGIPVGYGMRTSDKANGFGISEEHTITGVYHRVTTDGKIYPVYELSGIPERLFRADEIFITKICKNNDE